MAIRNSPRPRRTTLTEGLACSKMNFMSLTLQQQFREESPDVARTHPEYVSQLVDAILTGARNAGASDVHLLPGEDGLAMSWRVDGVLHPIDLLPRNLAPNVVARLKVLAQLLTYQTDVPQEGRIHQVEGDAETRVSTFPTIFGEKCVIRLFAGSHRFRYVDDLGFSPELGKALKTMLERRGGVILITGPAGSGKTTSIYACLREIVERAAEPRSVATLEDPVEAVMPGVAQSQVRPIAGFDYETGLKSLLRQDPEVIAVGEIRDRVTAQIAVQAALTGHLILTTFHAGQRRRSDQPAARNGVGAVPGPQRARGCLEPTAFPQALRLRNRLNGRGGEAGTRRSTGAVAGRLREMPRHRLFGPFSDRRVPDSRIACHWARRFSTGTMRSRSNARRLPGG